MRNVYDPNPEVPSSRGAKYWQKQHDARLEDCRALRQENKQLLTQLRKLEGLARLLYEHGGLAGAIEHLVKTLNSEMRSKHSLRKRLAEAEAENALLMLELKEGEVNRLNVADALVEARENVREWKNRALLLEAKLEGADEYIAPCIPEDPPTEDEKRASAFLGVPVRYLRTWAALGYGPRPPYEESELVAYLPWVESQFRGKKVGR